MRIIIIAIAIVTLGMVGCNKVVEHRCECRNIAGQIVESDTQYASEDIARDLCSQREDELNQIDPGAEVFSCSLD